MKFKDIPKPTFADFLDLFPEIDLPITITESLHHEFAKVNKPFPQSIIIDFVSKADHGEQNEFVEYVPCLKITSEKSFIAILFWKANLLSYEYILATYTPKGQLVKSQTISKFKVEDGQMQQSATTIREDWMIYTVAASYDPTDEEIDPEQTQTSGMEVMPNGEIVQY